MTKQVLMAVLVNRIVDHQLAAERSPKTDRDFWYHQGAIETLQSLIDKLDALWIAAPSDK